MRAAFSGGRKIESSASPPGEPKSLQVGRFEHDGARLAFRFLPGRPPGVVYLTGFNSHMEGRKARRIASACRARGLASLRFDHRGHGASSGDLAAGSIAVWYRDALALLCARLRGDLVLVGASMGVWLALLLARAFARGEGGGRALRACGLVGIGGAADFFGRRPALSPAEREALRRGKPVWRPSRYGDGPYPLTARMIEDGRRHPVLAESWDPGCPVHLLHGMRDPDAPWPEAVRIAEALRGSPVRVTLIPDGDHRLSRGPDLDRIEDALDRVLACRGSLPGRRRA